MRYPTAYRAVYRVSFAFSVLPLALLLRTPTRSESLLLPPRCETFEDIKGTNSPAESPSQFLLATRLPAQTADRTNKRTPVRPCYSENPRMKLCPGAKGLSTHRTVTGFICGLRPFKKASSTPSIDLESKGRRLNSHPSFAYTHITSPTCVIYQ